MPTDVESVLSWRGQEVVDRDGDKIGKIEEIYLDQQTDKPEWALVNAGLFGKSTFVPIAEASESGGQVTVPYGKDQVKDAPSIETGRELTQEEEAQLYGHYGLEYSEARSDSGLPEGGEGGEAQGGSGGEEPRDPEAVGHDTSGPTTDRAMTRSEEELEVGKTERETGRARLRKYIVTDEVQQTVPVRREEVRLEREPVTEGNVDEATTGPELSEEEHEVVLHEEEVVAEKRVVPKERVRLDKDTVTEEAQVSEEVRKEQIDVEGDDRSA